MDLAAGLIVPWGTLHRPAHSFFGQKGFGVGARGPPGGEGGGVPFLFHPKGNPWGDGVPPGGRGGEGTPFLFHPKGILKHGQEGYIADKIL